MWAMAVVHYRAAVAAAPNRAPPYKSLGIGYNKISRPDRALPALEQALRLDPTDAETAVLVKRLRREHAQGVETDRIKSLVDRSPVQEAGQTADERT
jgi:tetratricopeptide (TPR) repeat protein